MKEFTIKGDIIVKLSIDGKINARDEKHAKELLLQVIHEMHEGDEGGEDELTVQIIKHNLDAKEINNANV